MTGIVASLARSQWGVMLWSRRQNGFTNRFPTIARACQRLDPDTLLDGEVIALDESERVSFNRLQNRRSNANSIRFYTFDVLMYRGRSLVRVPLETRRELLSDIIGNLSNDEIRLSEAFQVKPADLIRVAREMDLEGFVAKRRDSLYEPGKRSGAWLK